MMEKIIDTIKKHPVVIALVVAFVLAYFFFGGKSTQSGVTDATAMAAAISASQQANAANAQTSAALEASKSHDNAQVQIAQYAANVSNTQTAAALLASQTQTQAALDNSKIAVYHDLATSTFENATASLMDAYKTQLSVASGGGVGSGSGSGATDMPRDGIYPGMTGIDYTGTYWTASSAGNPASVQNVNTGMYSVSELFNNIIRAVQGTGPIQTDTRTAGTPNGYGWANAGTDVLAQITAATAQPGAVTMTKVQ